MIAQLREPRVPLPAFPKYLRIEPTDIVADNNAQVIVRVFDSDFNALGAGVANCIEQRFAADAIDFVADERMQGPGAAFDDNAKINFLGIFEVLSDA